MKFTVATMMILSMLASTVAAGENKQTSYGVTYSGGSFPNVKSGEGFKMFLDQDQVRLERHGNEAHRRVGTAMAVEALTLGLGSVIALSHSKKLYVGIVWDGGEGKKGGLVVQADKNEYRGIIAALDGLTGKKAINADATQSTVIVQ